VAADPLTSTPITPEPCLPAKAGLPAAQIAHVSVVALDDRLSHRVAQLVDVESFTALVALLALSIPRCTASARRRGRNSGRRAARRRGGLPGLGDCGRQRLAKSSWTSTAPGRAPRGVEDLRGADSYAFAPQFFAETKSLAASPSGPLSSFGVGELFN